MKKYNYNLTMESNMTINSNTVFWDIIGDENNLGHLALKPKIDSS